MSLREIELLVLSYLSDLVSPLTARIGETAGRHTDASFLTLPVLFALMQRLFQTSRSARRQAHTPPPPSSPWRAVPAAPWHAGACGTRQAQARHSRPRSASSVASAECANTLDAASPAANSLTEPGYTGLHLPFISCI
eukprot:2011329-Pleurochrysis_carterae.AAC.2